MVQFAKITWDDGDVPRSTQFDDIYFSCHDGLGEAEHVFLDGNGLPARWQSRHDFTVAETGFGSSLNFLACWELWRRTALPEARLSYVAVEKYPVEPAAVRRIIGRWPRLSPLVEELLELYPLPLEGFHRIELEQGRVCLTLILGDALEMLGEVEAPPEGRVDAWFLDGFAPARNPDMWSPRLLEAVARLTRRRGTFATYTAAGHVRRGLQESGFEVQRVPGFEGKKEMLRGVRARGEVAESPAVRARHVAVIGAGIAGTSAARALLRSGCDVTLVERHATVAAEASGSSAGILMPYPTAREGARDAFFATAFTFARDLARTFDAGWIGSGVLELVTDARQKRRREALAGRGLPSHWATCVSAEQASELCGFEVDLPGVHFPGAGSVAPRRLCRALLERHVSRLRRCFSQVALRLERARGAWCVVGDGDRTLVRADAVVIASARDALEFSQCVDLPVHGVRGQLTCVPVSEPSRRLKCIVCYDGYVIPERDDQHVVGATFDRDDPESQMRPRDHERVLERLRHRLPQLHAALGIDDPERLDGRVGIRCASRDHLPLVGPLPGHDGLLVSIGHGSRGLVSAPIAGEILASWVTGAPAPLALSVLRALDPARFVRQGTP